MAYRISSVTDCLAIIFAITLVTSIALGLGTFANGIFATGFSLSASMSVACDVTCSSGKTRVVRSVFLIICVISSMSVVYGMFLRNDSFIGIGTTLITMSIFAEPVIEAPFASTHSTRISYDPIAELIGGNSNKQPPPIEETVEGDPNMESMLRVREKLRANGTRDIDSKPFNLFDAVERSPEFDNAVSEWDDMSRSVENKHMVSSNGVHADKQDVAWSTNEKFTDGMRRAKE